MNLKLLLLKLSATIIDISIIYILSIITSGLIPLNKYFVGLTIFTISLFLYYIISYTLFSQTIGKYILGLKLFTNSRTILSFKKILIRELILKLSVLIIPVFILLYNYPVIDFYIGAIITSIIWLIILLFFCLLFRKNWWNLFLKTKTERIDISKQKAIRAYVLLFTFYLISFFVIQLINNINQNNNLSFLGFNCPQKFQKHLLTSEVKESKQFLLKQKLKSKEYIFELFKTNDIVILCERSHRETTQWDFITEIVEDKRFINNVGNIFTEYGSYIKQEQLDTFLRTTFLEDTELNKEVAKLSNYMNTGFFNFIKSLNVLNNKLPDTLKINEYFTDANKYHEYIRTSIDSNRVHRDSLMAFRIISKFKNIQKENRKKCLVVTNYRHAFGKVIKNGIEVKQFNYNQAKYIFDAFPNKTANVIINDLAMTFFQIQYPIHYGIWDRAFEEIGNISVGFNLKNSPFGKFKFDLFPFINRNDIKYEDVFTGYVFVNPYDKWNFNSYYPNRVYAAKQEYLNKLKTGIIDNESYIFYIANYEYNKLKDISFWKIWYSLYSIIPLLIYFTLLLVALLVSLYHFTRIVFQKKHS